MREIVALQLGQCGNQLGAELFTSLGREVLCTEGCHRDKFFHPGASGRAVARAVLVDMEPKAIATAHSIAKESGTWEYSPRSVLHAQSGSGNNWAQGFHTMGAMAGSRCEEAVRREVEECDTFEGFMVLQSAGGGTGSGLGTFVSEAMRDLYPKALMVNQLVWPHRSGGVIVQSYNALLTLSHLQEVADAIILTANDRLDAICAHDYKMAEVSVSAMNQAAAQDLASVVLPASLHGAGDQRTALSLHDVVLQTCPHPSYKMLTVESSPRMPNKSLKFATDNWASVITQGIEAAHGLSVVARARGCGGGGSKPCQSLSSLLILRGRGAAHEVTHGALEGFTNGLHSVRGHSWHEGRVVAAASSERPLSSDVAYEKMATVVSNSQAAIPMMEHAAIRATEMLHNKAYLHHYERFGVSQLDMEEALVKTEQVVADYQGL